MEYFYLGIIFLFGAALGSFVAVIVDRYNTGLPWSRGRSICFSCNIQLKREDLYPIFSFLFLKGRCRYCKSKIPRQTFFVEILMGVLSVLASLKSGLLLVDFSILHNSYFIIQSHISLLLATNYLLLTAIFATILLISVYDLKHFIIPDSFLVYFFIFSFIYSFSSILHNSYFIIQSFISGFILALPFLAIFLISKGRWLGFGDVKYIAVIGFLLGFIEGLSAVVLSFWIGAAFAILALFLKKIAPYINLPLFKNNLTIKSEIPFGPFLSLGVIISLLLNLDLFKINELFF